MPTPSRAYVIRPYVATAALWPDIQRGRGFGPERLDEAQQVAVRVLRQELPLALPRRARADVVSGVA